MAKQRFSPFPNLTESKTLRKSKENVLKIWIGCYFKCIGSKYFGTYRLKMLEWISCTYSVFLKFSTLKWKSFLSLRLISQEHSQLQFQEFQYFDTNNSEPSWNSSFLFFLMKRSRSELKWNFLNFWLTRQTIRAGMWILFG